MADRHIRDSGALQRAIDEQSGAEFVSVPPTDTGSNMGRGYARIGSSKYREGTAGPLQYYPEISHVRGTYERDPLSGEYFPVTIFPEPK